MKETSVEFCIFAGTIAVRTGNGGCIAGRAASAPVGRKEVPPGGWHAAASEIEVESAAAGLDAIAGVIRRG